MKNLIKTFGLVFLPFVLGGCLSRAPLNVETFAFSPPAMSQTNSAESGCVLGIKSLQVAPPFDSRFFIYRTGEFSYQCDAYAEFLELPAEVLAAPVGDMLLGDGCCRAVGGAGDDPRPDKLVEIKITQLYGDIRKPGSPSAVLAMQIKLLDTTNGLSGKVIFTRTCSRSVPIKSTKPTALMAGWNQGLAEVFAEVAPEIVRREAESSSR